MAEMRQNLTISGNSITGTVRGITAGVNREFTINCYDSASQLTYTGSSSATVVAGQQVVVSITVKPSGASMGTPQLQVSSTASVQRPGYGSTTTRITFEVSNTGIAPATGVALAMRSYNSGAISDTKVTVGTVAAGENKLVSASFSGTSEWSFESNYVTRATYTLSYNEGTDLTGSISVQ